MDHAGTSLVRAKRVRLTGSQLEKVAGLAGVALGLALGAVLGPMALWGDSALQLELPDFGRWLDWLRKIVEWLKIGGVALALVGSAAFILTWAASHLRQAHAVSRPLVGYLALLSSYVPVGLTIVAGLGTVVPTLAPLVLKAFALAVVIGAFSWTLAVIALVLGGDKQDLRRARRALIYAGTPWYTLALWIATKL